MEEKDGYMTTAELCELLRLTPQALYAMRNKGTPIPCHKIGNRLRFRRSDIHKWMDGNKVPVSQTVADICKEVQL